MRFSDQLLVILNQLLHSLTKILKSKIGRDQRISAFFFKWRRKNNWTWINIFLSIVCVCVCENKSLSEWGSKVNTCQIFSIFNTLQWWLKTKSTIKMWWLCCFYPERLHGNTILENPWPLDSYNIDKVHKFKMVKNYWRENVWFNHVF